MEVAIVSCNKGSTNAPLDCVYRSTCRQANTEAIQVPVSDSFGEEMCQDIFNNALNDREIPKISYYNCKCQEGGIKCKSVEVHRLQALHGGEYENQCLPNFSKSGASGLIS